jgi:hypothetical protein
VVVEDITDVVPKVVVNITAVVAVVVQAFT